MINKIGTSVALASFIIGSILFLTQFFSNSRGVILFGYSFVISAGLVNLGIFIVLILKIITEKDNRIKHLKTSALMLANIPIVLIYLFFVFKGPY